MGFDVEDLAAVVSSLISIDLEFNCFGEKLPFLLRTEERFGNRVHVDRPDGNLLLLLETTVKEDTGSKLSDDRTSSIELLENFIIAG